jgi:hypothetical protein
MAPKPCLQLLAWGGLVGVKRSLGRSIMVFGELRAPTDDRETQLKRVRTFIHMYLYAMLEFNNSSKRDSLERVGGGGAGVRVMGLHMDLHKRRVGHWCPVDCYCPAAHTQKRMRAHLATPFCSIPCRRRRHRGGGDVVFAVCSLSSVGPLGLEDSGLRAARMCVSHGSRNAQSDHHGQLLQSRAAKGRWKQTLPSTGLRSCCCTIQRGNHFGPEERHLVRKSRCVLSCLAQVSLVESRDC